MFQLWLKTTLLRRPLHLLGTALGIALTVALLASLGSFITNASGQMTARAASTVPVDWQVQLVPGVEGQTIISEIKKATLTTGLESVNYADVTGFSAITNGTEQTTGKGKVLGIPSTYAATFPGQIRSLVGPQDVSNNGVLIAQQTAANLHVSIGDTVTILRVGLLSLEVKVTGVIDLPNADALFQAVGIPQGAAPQAPPDNVLLMSQEQWQTIFAEQAAVRPDSTRVQLHVTLDRSSLPTDPVKAYQEVTGRANNLEARIAGSGIVGNNLAARLDGARTDATYARLIFLFLGLPGLVLSSILTFAVANSGSARRRKEQSLLRVRGASSTTLLQLAGIEAGLVAVIGVVVGLALAFFASTVLLSSANVSRSAFLVWGGSSVMVGLLLAAIAILVPAWRDARNTTVTQSRLVVGRATAPLWQRLYLDIILLVIAGIVFWRTAASGYQIVLAPEGVAQTSVSYEALVAPLLMWLGLALLTLRLWRGFLFKGQRLLAGTLKPLAGDLAGTVSSSFKRQRGRLATGVVLIALAFSFATSTAIFNSTYNAQSGVDAALTNGADVTVTGTMAAPASTRLNELSTIKDVTSAQPMMHRFAYVGNDLQDMYGIDVTHLGEATKLSNAYFQGGNAKDILAALAAKPDAVLVSEETVLDYQLQVGDTINLRLQTSSDNQYHTIPFTFVGVAREFPTAPKDSFLVANAVYIAQQTGIDTSEVVLLKTTQLESVSQAAQKIVADLPGVKVTTLNDAKHLIGSSLTAVDLRGLTRLELAFALLLVMGATGLILALGLAERKRTFTILSALGAKRPHLGAFLWSEGLFLLISGAVVGSLTGVAIAQVLVKDLTGVFDPPPDALLVPWLYLGLLLVLAVTATVMAIRAAFAASRQPVVQGLRNL
jgi:putative ABC transport system permease protein